MAGAKTHTRRLDRSNYSVGDNIWIKEAWRTLEGYEGVKPSEIPKDEPIAYLEDYLTHPEKHLLIIGSHYYREYDCRPWRPSIFMPRKFSRITLLVIDVWSELLQAITEEDAIKEGVGYGFQMNAGWPDYRHINKNGVCTLTQDTAVMSFSTLWDSINGKKPGCAWKDNPIVHVTEFKLLGVKNGKEND